MTGSVYVLNQGGAGSNVTALSGSVTGLLLGGVAVSNANGVPITDAGGSLTVDGTVAISNPQTTVTTLSGSVAGLLLGGVNVSNANPIPISDAGGSLTVDGSVSITGTPTVTLASTIINSGSVTGLLQGGVAVSAANPLAVSVGNTVTVAAHSVTQGTAAAIGAPWPFIMVSGSDVVGTVSHPIYITGSIGQTVGGVNVANGNPLPVSDAGGSLTVDGTVTVTQGTAAGMGAPWPMILVSGSDPVGTTSHPMWITGSVFVLNQGGAGSNVTALSGSVTGLLLGGVAVSNANGVPVTDAGGSLTVDGTVAISNPQTTVTTLSGSLVGHLVGGVALSNANPFPISDAGGSITVDGAVTVASTVINSGSITGLLLGGVAVSNANPIPIGDAGGSLTVDGSVSISGTPAVTLAGTIINSGSVTGLLQGGVAVSAANPIAVSVGNTVTVAAHSITSGSVTGLLVGGQPVSQANAVPVTDAGGSLTVDGTITALSEFTDNSGFTDNTSKVLAVGYYLDESVGVSLTENDIAAARIDGKRAQVVVLEDQTTRGQRLSIDASGSMKVREIRSANSTATSLTASITSQLLVAANTTRLGVAIFNDSTTQLFLKFGASATSNSYSLRMMPDDYLEVPYGYTGQIDGLWFSATGSARITEFVG